MEIPQKPRSRFFWISVLCVLLLIGGALLGLFVLPSIIAARQKAALLPGETPEASPTATVLLNPPTESPGIAVGEPTPGSTFVPTPAPTPINPQDSMSDTVAFAKQSVVIVLAQYGKSQVMHSGFVYGDGFIVTSYKGFEKASSYTVLINGETTPTLASVVQYDVESDLMVLSTSRTDLVPVTWAQSVFVKPGDFVIAVGTPLDTRYQNLVTRGIISGVNQTLSGSKTQYLITDAATNPGESGGVLFNNRGEMIGMLTDIRVDAGYDSKGDPVSALGMTFAVPSDAISPILKTLITGRSIQRASLDILVVELTARQKSALGLENGVRVTFVKTGGTAQLAGIVTGDILISYNGVALTNTAMLDSLVASSHVGDTAAIARIRNGVVETISIIIKDAAQ